MLQLRVLSSHSSCKGDTAYEADIISKIDKYARNILASESELKQHNLKGERLEATSSCEIQCSTSHPRLEQHSCCRINEGQFSFSFLSVVTSLS